MTYRVQQKCRLPKWWQMQQIKGISFLCFTLVTGADWMKTQLLNSWALKSFAILHSLFAGPSQGGDFGVFSPPPPMFGRIVNPISTRGADYAHHSTTSPLNFSDLATALHYVSTKNNTSECKYVLMYLTGKQ